MEENIYNLETYNYSLPKELIAQYPCDIRDKSRLLHYNKKNKTISHHIFSNLPDLLNSNSVLVLNNTKVIKARFFAQTNKNKIVEILLIKPETSDNLTWKIFSKPQKYLKDINEVSVYTSDKKYSFKVSVIDIETIKFNSHEDLKFILNNIGKMPLPPYIKRENINESIDKVDEDRYQTVFAKVEGAVAAPTASLHFTNELLEKIQKKGIEIIYITLHVGPGTFLPIRSNDIREHKLIAEFFQVEKKSWERILELKKNKKNIVACGTTVVRTLEYLASKSDELIFNNEVCSGLNDLYITPGYKFKIVNSLITNFHLPKSSLLLLVSAFINWSELKDIYNEAIKERYMFFSYGNAMFLDF